MRGGVSSVLSRGCSQPVIGRASGAAPGLGSVPSCGERHLALALLPTYHLGVATVGGGS